VSPETVRRKPKKPVYGREQPCAWCGKRYEIKKSDQLFCSPKCGAKYRAEYPGERCN